MVGGLPKSDGRRWGNSEVGVGVKALKGGGVNSVGGQQWRGLQHLRTALHITSISFQDSLS